MATATSCSSRTISSCASTGGRNKKDDWRDDYNNMMDDTSLRLNEICKDPTNIDQAKSAVDSLARGFNSIAQHWSFYRSLMSEQKREQAFWNSADGRVSGDYDHPKTWTFGYESFIRAPDAFRDAFVYSNRGDSGSEHNERWKFAGRRYWSWNTDHGSDGQRYSYIQIWSGSNYDEIRINSANRHSVGSHQCKYDFKSGLTRNARWRLVYTRIDLTDQSKWPFHGLE